jgi:hypothetical protein
MPIPWKAIQRENPRDPNAAPKYYALDVTRSLLDEEDAAHAIGVRSGLSGSILDLRLRGNGGKPAGVMSFARRGASPREGTERRTPNIEHRTSQRRTLDDCEA